MPNFFERASAGINSLINDAAIRARAAKSTTSALTRVGGEFGERLSRALERAAALRRSKDVETDELCDLQVGQNCYEDSPGFMRTQLWESLLDRSGESSMISKATQASKETTDGGLSDGEDILDDMCAVLAADGYYETLQDAFGMTERTNASKDVGSSSDAWNENIGHRLNEIWLALFPITSTLSPRLKRGQMEEKRWLVFSRLTLCTTRKSATVKAWLSLQVFF